jgi:hypothetical protein
MESNINNKPFMDLSLREILNNIARTFMDIINDILNLKSYNLKNDILPIFTKKDRLIYLGIILIMISLFIYFVFVSDSSNMKNNGTNINIS